MFGCVRDSLIYPQIAQEMPKIVIFEMLVYFSMYNCAGYFPYLFYIIDLSALTACIFRFKNFISAQSLLLNPLLLSISLYCAVPQCLSGLVSKLPLHFPKKTMCTWQPETSGSDDVSVGDKNDNFLEFK